MSRWIKQWEVEGSKGTVYKVSQAEDGSWGCSCPDWTHRHRDCKHIKQIQSGMSGPPVVVQNPAAAMETKKTIEDALSRGSVIEWF